MDYSKVTIEKFIDVTEMLGKCDGSYKDILINQKVFSLLTGISQDVIDNWSVEEWKEKRKIIEFMKETPEASSMSEEITVGKKKFKRVLDARKIKFGKYIDIMESNKSDRERIESMHMSMGLLLYEVPKEKMSYEDKCEFLHKHTTMDLVLPHMVFFSRVLTELIQVLPDYLKSQMMSLKTTIESQSQLTDSQNIGDGSLV